MAGESLSNPSMFEDDSSDWEYEYDETETETFYVTLDISSAPSMRTKSKANQNKVPLASAPSNPVAPNQTFDEEASSPSPEPINNLSNESRDSSNSIQILDFHTSNPLISFQDQIYSCSWTTTLGTDLLLNPARPTSAGSTNPILAATRHKLSARPANLVPRREPRSSVPSSSIPTAQDAINLPLADGSRPTRIPLESHASLARQRQAAFLEKLMAIKAAKGEKDAVTVYAQKSNTGTGWRVERKAKLEKKAEDEKRDRETTAKAGHDSHDPAKEVGDPAESFAVRRASGRPRGRSRAPSRAQPRPSHYRGRKYKGTFFRGTEPRRESSLLSDTGSGSIMTPKRWQDLEQAGESTTGGVDGSLVQPSIGNHDANMPEGMDSGADSSRAESSNRSWNKERQVRGQDIVMEDDLLEMESADDVVMRDS